ncbi:MAG TPA: F0F1 ATP synthase subunit B [Streptosporangiaceae bacterium]|nr:F0F1 ATP synthase subunit B [Streptosporangiaceae bacterium]
MYQHLALVTPQTGNPLVPGWTEVIWGGIAFLIVFVALWRLLLPRIAKTLQERTDAIEGGIDRAARAEAEAERLAEQYRTQLADARHDAARLREESREEGARIIAELREQAQAEAARIMQAAQAQIAADRQQAFASLRNEVGTLAVELASKIVGESLADEARQSRVVDRFLAELEASEGQTSGARTSS